MQTALYKHEARQVSDLIPYAKNSRTHSDAQISQVAASIREFGFTNPVLIDENNSIIAGHGRILAAQKLKIDEVPCIILDGLTENQKKAYIIADNKLALNAGWDEELLTLELVDLKESDFDIALTGFEGDELKYLLGAIDDVGMPELPGGEKEPYQQKTFILHDEQAEIVEDAIMRARTKPEIDTGLNENSNGNALAYICEQFLK